MPYNDPDKQRQARRESARRRRNGSTGSTPHVEPQPAPHAHDAADAGATAAGRSRVVEPGGYASLLLDVLLDELDRVRATGADPMIRGRVVAQLVGTGLKAAGYADLEPQIAELKLAVAGINADRDATRTGPRRLPA